MNLSGIAAITREDVLKILNILADYKLCGNLLSVHLADLGINDDAQLMEDIYELFNISDSYEQSMDHQGGLHLALQMYLQKVRGLDYQRKVADSFKYVEVVQHTINGSSSALKEHNILMGLHMQMVGQHKLMGTAGFLSGCQGIGRNIQNGMCRDTFVLSRANNLPELVFNQNSGQDKNNRKRFFELDHAQ